MSWPLFGGHRDHEARLAPNTGVLVRATEDELMKNFQTLTALRESVRGDTRVNQRRPLGGGDVERRFEGQ